MSPEYRERLGAHRAAKRAAFGLGGTVVETPLGGTIRVGRQADENRSGSEA